MDDDVQFESLAAMLERDGPLPAERALPLLREAARSLAEAHAAGVLHCDVQPGTLLVADDGRVLLAESALARQQGGARQPDAPHAEQPASPFYYPPEAARAKPLDARSDLFLLGATFYHAMVGRPPFDDPDPEMRALQYARNDVPALDEQVPNTPVLVNLLMKKLLRRDPDERYTSAEELLAVVERTERMLQKRQPARRIVVAAPPAVEAEPDDIPRIRLPDEPPASDEATPEESPPPVRGMATPFWLSKAFIYGAAAGGFLLIVLVLLLLRGSRRPEALAALRLPPPPPSADAAPPMPTTSAPVKRPPDPGPAPPAEPPVPAKRSWTRLEDRIAASSKEEEAPSAKETGPSSQDFSFHARDARFENSVNRNNATEPRYESGTDKDCIGYWFPDNALAKWELKLAAPGTFQVEILFAAQDGAVGNEYVVSVGGQELRGTVRDTGNWGEFETDSPGTLTLEKAGTYALVVKAGKKKATNAPLMNLRAVQLRRVAKP